MAHADPLEVGCNRLEKIIVFPEDGSGIRLTIERYIHKSDIQLMRRRDQFVLPDFLQAKSRAVTTVYQDIADEHGSSHEILVTPLCVGRRTCWTSACGSRIFERDGNP